MRDDPTAALFSGAELRGDEPGPLLRGREPAVVVGHGLGDLAALGTARYVEASSSGTELGDLVRETLTGDEPAGLQSALPRAR